MLGGSLGFEVLIESFIGDNWAWGSHGWCECGFHESVGPGRRDYNSLIFGFGVDSDSVRANSSDLVEILMRSTRRVGSRGQIWRLSETVSVGVVMVGGALLDL